MKIKVIAVLLALCICLMLPVFAETAVGMNWIEISDAEGLARIAFNPSGSYRLTSDIDMAGIEWVPVSFSGEFDGAGHAILNLTISEPGPNHFTSLDGNQISYDTVGAAMFDRVEGGYIHDLSLLGVRVDVTTDQHCFCAALMGGALGATVKNCTINGSIRLKSSAQMAGVSGVGGYMCGTVSNSTVQVELIYEDTNREVDSEEFAGAMIACGYGDITDCKVNTYIYASVHGYCHNGGLIGMYARGASKSASARIANNEVGCTINFFEDVGSRRAYAKLYVGEELNHGVTYHNNTKLRFKKNESKNFSKALYPCTCAEAAVETVVAPTATEFGYTVSSCPTCGYRYMKDFTLRASEGAQTPETETVTEQETVEETEVSAEETEQETEG